MGIYLIKMRCEKIVSQWGCMGAGDMISWEIVRPATTIELQNHSTQWTDNGDGTVTITNVQFDTYVNGQRYGMPDPDKEIKRQLSLF